jgi:hypothetical protein
MGLMWLSGIAIISMERDWVVKLDTSVVTRNFAGSKARRKNFVICYHRDDSATLTTKTRILCYTQHICDVGLRVSRCKRNVIYKVKVFLFH